MNTPTNSPRLYRYFQKIALVVGIGLSGAGWAIDSPGTLLAGLIVALHGMVALVVLFVDERQISARKNQ